MSFSYPPPLQKKEKKITFYYNLALCLCLQCTCQTKISSTCQDKHQLSHSAYLDKIAVNLCWFIKLFYCLLDHQSSKCCLSLFFFTLFPLSFFLSLPLIFCHLCLTYHLFSRLAFYQLQANATKTNIPTLSAQCGKYQTPTSQSSVTWALETTVNHNNVMF